MYEIFDLVWLLSWTFGILYNIVFSFDFQLLSLSYTVLQYTLEFIEYQVNFIVKTPDNIELPFQIVSDSLVIYIITELS